MIFKSFVTDLDRDHVRGKKVVTQIEVEAGVMIVITRMAVTVTLVTVVILIATQIIVGVEVGVKVVVVRLVRNRKIISQNHLRMKVAVRWPLLY